MPKPGGMAQDPRPADANRLKGSVAPPNSPDPVMPPATALAAAAPAAPAAPAAAPHAAGKPPRPKAAIKPAAAPADAAAGAAAAAAPHAQGPAAPAAAAGGSHQRQGSGDSDNTPLTFSSPFVVGAELRQGAAGAAPHAQHPADERRPGGVLRTGSGLGDVGGSASANRMRRTVSWSDMDNRAPLAQVVEYEPSEQHSTRSEDDWGSQSSSACFCCIQ